LELPFRKGYTYRLSIDWPRLRGLRSLVNHFPVGGKTRDLLQGAA
jgi:hypothetical protein